MTRNTYTITVSLKAFFTDCRAQAKIFISEDIQTVLDLENKISRIFGIKDFHLLSNENLLPSCEDIRLLDKGDIVCVQPNDSHTNLLLPKRFYYTKDETIGCKKKKRLYSDDECPIKEKKCKKKKKESASFSDEQFDSLPENKVNKKLEDFSKEMKRKNKKRKDKAYINNVSQPEQNLSSNTPHSIKKIKHSNLHVKKDRICSLIDLKIQESANVEKEKVGAEHYININSEKQGNINLLSNGSSVVISKTKIASVADNHSLPKSTAQSNKTTNKKLVSPSKDSSFKMIVDSSSSSSDSEVEKTITKTKQLVSNMNQSKCSGQSINKTEIEKSVTEESNESDDYDKIPKKGCSFYHLPVKKRNLWSTSPLQKTTNHVKIEKVPVTVINTDLSKFVFNPFNVGVIPVPSHETADKHIRNDFSTSETNIVNLSQHNSISLSSTGNSLIGEIHPSPCDEFKTKFIPYVNNKTGKQTVEKIYESSTEDQCILSKLISKSSPKSEELPPVISDKVVDDNDSKTFQEEKTKKSIFVNNWRKNIFNKLNDGTQSSLPNQDETSIVVNKVLKANENGQTENMSNHPPEVSPKLMKLNSNSYNVRKRNTTNQLGVNYYMKLLNKIDWDLSKSISNVNPDEIQSSYRNGLVGQENSSLSVNNKINSLENVDLSESISNVNPDEVQSPSENEELVGQEKSSLYVKNKMNSLENIDTTSVSSTVNDFVTKRKRKRKHKKKIRADTPAPVKRCHYLPSKQLTLLKGSPKLHIRFESDEKDYPHVKENEVSANFEKSIEKVKVLQDVSLDLSRTETNICHRSISTERDVEGNNPASCILSIGITDASKPTEKEFEIVSVLNNGVSTKSSGLSSMNSVKLHKENENTVISNECVLSNLKDCIGNEKNLESGIQKSALDYTNENLTSYENTCIIKSSSNSPKLSNISPEEALAQAKVALLKEVGFLAPDQSSTTRTCQYINAGVQSINDG